MKQLILVLALLLPIALFGQAVNRQELIRTNDLIRGATVHNKDGQATNLTVHGVRSSDGTAGADAITGGVTFRDGIYTGGEIFGTNWVTNAVSAIYKDGAVKGTNINALDFRAGPDVSFQVVSGAVQAVSVTGLVINTTGTGGLMRSNAPNFHAPTLDGTNLPTQIDAQIGAADALLLQSATNYANGVTNASIVRQTQATALSNALVTLAYSIGTDATNFSLLASNAVRLVAGLDATNHAAAILQSATNYANAVTNSSLARQTQLTALSNALVSLSYTIGANDTNYTLTASNGVRIVAGLDATNHANAILQSSTNYANSLASTLSNSVVLLAWSIGADATNFTLNASNAVRLVAGLAETNHANAILQAATNYANSVTNSSIARQTQLTALSNALITFSYSIGANGTNYTLTASNNVRLVAGLAATNHADAILASSTNFTRAYAQPLGTSAITTNGNQFGASVTITLKDGLWVTNVVIFGQQTNVGNADFSRGLTNYSGTLPVHSVAGFTSGNGTEYGLEGFLDPSTGFLLWFSVTNVFATMTNRYVADHLPSPGDCWRIKSTNGYEILWTNGPCGGSSADIWTNSQDGFISPVGPYVGTPPIQTNAINFEFYRTGPLSYLAGANFANLSTNTDADGWLYYNDASIGVSIQSAGIGGHGANIGAYLYAARGLANAAGVAFAESTVSGSTNVGFAAIASTGGYGGSTRTVGLYAETTVSGYGDNPLVEDAVSLLDSRDSGLPLLVGRTNNGTRVFSLQNDGSVSLTSKTNRYSDDGTQLSRDGARVGMYGTTTLIASNAASFQLDFTPGVGTTHYQMTNMANNFTINLTNLYTDTYGPRDAWFYFETDSTGSRTVTVSTNGLTTGTRVSWGFNSITNGATSFTVTNRARLNLVRNRAGVISAAYEFQQ